MSTRAGRSTDLDASSRRRARRVPVRARSLRLVLVGSALLALVLFGWLSFLGVPPIAEEAQAAGVKRVQTGTTTVVANGGTSTRTVTITSVDTTKAFLLFESTHDGNRPVQSMVRGRIATATTLEFVRVSDEAAPGTTINVRWYVVEYAYGVSVQRGSVTQSPMPANVAITAVASLSQAFVTWSKTVGSGFTSFDDNEPIVGELTTTSNLQFRGEADAAATIWWQVVEFTSAADINVQKGSVTTMTGTTASVTATLGTAVDTSKTFVLASLLTTGGGADMGARMVRARLTDASTITFDRSVTGTPDDITEIHWQAVELKDGSLVQHGSEDFATADGSETVTLARPIDTNRAVAFASVQSVGGQNQGRTAYVGDDIPGAASFRMTLTATQLTIVRDHTAGAADVGWFVVEWGPAGLAGVKKVQTGTTTIDSNGGTSTLSVAITAVDAAKSFLLFQTSSNSGDPGDSYVRGRIASSTSLEFVRVSDAAAPGSTVTIRWYVVEYAAGVSVQRGETTQSATTVNVAITAVGSLRQAFVTWSKTPAAADTSIGSDDPLLGELTTTANLQFRTDSASAGHTIWWQVIEFTNPAYVNVQKGSITTMTGATTSVTATLSESVDVAKTFLLVGYRSSAAGTDIGSRLLRAQLTNANTITIDRSTSGSPGNDDIEEIVWQAVELRDGSTVQRGTEDFASADGSEVVTLSSVDLDRTVAFSGSQTLGGQALGRSPYTADDVVGVSSFRMSLTSSTQLTIDRGNTADAADVGWFVVQFAPAVSFSASTSSGSEGTTPANLAVTLSGDSDATITVDYVVTGGTATGSGTDYTLASGTLTFVAGDTSENVAITVVSDTLDENDETVVVTLYNAANANLGATTTHTFTITDDDAPPTVTLGLSGNPMAEAAGAATVTATLSATSSFDVTVNLAFTGTATLTSDYTRSGTSIVIAAGATSGTVTLTAVQDALDEAAETVVVDISTVTNGAESGTQQVTASITDDDAAPTVTLSLAGSPMAEAAGTATVTATLSAASGQDVTVDLAFAGTATLTTDYTRSGASILIAAGATTGAVTLTAVQDTLDEAAESVIVDISGVTNGAESGTQQVTASITDDDSAPTVTLGVGGSPMAEAAGTATVTATLSTASGLDVTVDLAFSGTATLTSDYTRSGTSILIAAGSTTGTVTLTAVQDALDEASETVIVDISGVTNGAESGTQQVTASITDDDAAPAVTLGLSGSPLAEAAGAATVTATLSAASGQDVTVDLAFAGTATLTSDYTRSGASITILAGATTGTVTLTAVQDTLDEANETVVVDISSVTNGAESGTQQVTATITDDDAQPTVTLSLSASPMAEAAGAATVTATLSGASGLDVTVNLAFSGTATLTSDYTRSGTSIAILAGATTGTVTLTAVQDTLDEASETVIVDISSVTNGAESGTQQVTASITDDDAPPTVTLGLTGSPMAEAAGTATVTATLSAASGLDVTVDLAFAGTATLTSDYTRSGASILVAAGAASGTVTLTAVQDSVDEPNETVVVDIDAVTNGAESGTQQVTATIADDDGGVTVTLALTGSPFAEAAGTATVTATLDAASGLDVTVNLAFSGTATLTSDYTRSGTSIVIVAGATSGTVTLTAVQDALDENDETVVVDISSVTNGAESGTQQVTATITDDDAAPAVTLGLSGSPVAEAGGTATVTATLGAVSGRDVTVDLSFAGTATLTSDYARSGTSVTILAGATTGTVTLTAVQDALDEADETVVVDIDTVTNGAESGTQQVTATIADDDAPPTVTLGLSGSPAAEASGTATVTATLGTASGLDVTVNLAFAGTATLTSDYTRSGTSIVIAAGALSGTVTLTAVQDTLDESDETVVVDIDTVTNGAESGTQQVTASIADDDAVPSVTLALAGSPMAEAGGNATVTATLSAASSFDVTVNLLFGGSATLTSDYTRTGASIVIAAGGTTGTVTLTAVQDTLDEADTETVIVDIDTVTNGVESGSQQVIAGISDDDAASGVTLGVSGTPMAEASGVATVTATLSAVSGLDVTVNLAFSGTATLTDDYTRSGTSILIPAGSTTGSITLTAAQDALDEPDESVLVDVDSVTNGAESGSQQITAIVADDDAAPTVTLSLAGSPMAEAAGVATVTATLSAVSGQTVTVNLAFTGTATLTSDYTRSGTSIVIAAGGTSGTLTLTTVQDSLDELDETVVVDVDSVANGAESGTQQATLTIADDDATPTVTLALTGSPMAEAAGVATVTATLSASSGLDVTVNLGFSGTATVASDYSRSGTSILIAAGGTTGSITLTAAQDTLDEANETVAVDVDTVTNAAESGTQQVTATITDDDALPTVTLALSGSPMAEAAGVATVTATLSAASSFDVTVTLGLSGTATLTGDYTRSGTTVAVAAGGTSGSVSLTAVQDSLVDPAETIVVDVNAVTNGAESGTQQVTASIADDDVAGLTVSQSGGSTVVVEAGATDTFTVVLTAQPSSNVVLSVASGNTSEALVSPATLTFSPANWSAAQTGTVTGVQDNAVDGDKTVTLTLSVVDASSADEFDGVADATVLATVTDSGVGGGGGGGAGPCTPGWSGCPTSFAYSASLELAWTDAGVRLSWAESDSPYVRGFLLWREDGGPWTLAVTLASGETEYVDGDGSEESGYRLTQFTAYDADHGYPDDMAHPETIAGWETIVTKSLAPAAPPPSPIAEPSVDGPASGAAPNRPPSTEPPTRTAPGPARPSWWVLPLGGALGSGFLVALWVAAKSLGKPEPRARLLSVPRQRPPFALRAHLHRFETVEWSEALFATSPPTAHATPAHVPPVPSPPVSPGQRTVVWDDLAAQLNIVKTSPREAVKPKATDEPHDAREGR